MRIEIISGSPRPNSVTHRVALHLQKLLQEKTEHEVDIIHLKDWNLPAVQSVFVSVDYTPDEFKPLAKRMFGGRRLHSCIARIQWQLFACYEKPGRSFSQTTSQTLWNCNSISRPIGRYPGFATNATIGKCIVWDRLALFVDRRRSGQKVRCGREPGRSEFLQ